MERLFQQIVSLSLSASWLVLAVLALRLLLKKAPRRIVCLLWALVALRLMVPAQIVWRASLVPSPETVAQTAQTTFARPENPMSAAAQTPEMPEQTAVPSGVSERIQILCSVWLCGMGAMLLWAAVSDVRLRVRLRSAVLLKDNIRLCEGIGTPFVLGVVRPRMYLPFGLDAEQTEYVLAHERAHIARGDHIWKPLGWLLLSVYWFHPLLWASFALMCRDLEMACDERVARTLDRAGLAAYAEALLDCGCRRRGALVSPVAFGEVSVKARVKAVLRYRKPVFLRVAAAVLAVAAAGAFFLTEQPAKALPLPESFVIDPSIGHPDDLPPEPVETAQPQETQNAPQMNTASSADAAQAQYDAYLQASDPQAQLQEMVRQINAENALKNQQAAAANRANGSAPQSTDPFGDTSRFDSPQFGAPADPTGGYPTIPGTDSNGAISIDLSP